MSKKNEISEELRRLLEGKTDPSDIAWTVARYQSRKTAERRLQAARRRFIAECGFKRTITNEQRNALVFGFAMSNQGLFCEWVKQNHPEVISGSNINTPF